MEPLKGKAARASDLDPVYTKQQRIAELASVRLQLLGDLELASTGP